MRGTLETFPVAAVIVTYNRLEKLKIALKCYERQTLLPKYLVVVNNCSTDGTKEYLDEWVKNVSYIKKIVINTDNNLGGSGGFYIGQKKALELDVDWIYLSDDDAYPEESYFFKINNFLKDKNINDISAVCGKVDQPKKNNGHCVYLNKWNYPLYTYIPDKEYVEKKVIDIDGTSFVGICINRRILLKAGLVNKDYFIWFDDFEQCYRLKKYGSIYALSNCKIYHDISSEDIGLSWKTYYGFRNTANFIKNNLKMQMPYLITLMILRSCMSFLLKSHSIKELKVRLTAIKDGLNDSLGKHSIYKPGWKP